MTDQPTYVLDDDVRGILFDLDDTLFDHTGAAEAAVGAWTQQLPGWTLSPAETAACWRRIEDRHFAAYAAGEISFGEQRRARVRDFVPGAADHDDAGLDSVFATYLQHYEAAWRAVPDAVQVVTRALELGYGVGVLTNGRTDQQRAKLVRIGLDDPRLVLLATDRLPAMKPAPEAFDAACAALALPPWAVLMVGDNRSADVDGALRAGLRALLVTPVAPGGDHPPSWVTSVGGLRFPSVPLR